MTRLLRTAPQFALLTLCCAGESPRPAGSAALQKKAPVRVFYNGRVYTAAAESARLVQAIAVGAARILRTGTSDALFKDFPGATRIDLHGRTVVPGFNDAHFHHEAFPSNLELQFRSMEPSVSELREAIVAATARNPGRWITGRVGITVLEDATVNRELLDAISGTSPVFLLAFYGHGHLLNSKALDALGIRDDVQDPRGGHFGRTKAGQLDGHAYEYAEWITGRAPVLGPAGPLSSAGGSKGAGPADALDQLAALDRRSGAPRPRLRRLQRRCVLASSTAISCSPSRMSDSSASPSSSSRTPLTLPRWPCWRSAGGRNDAPCVSPPSRAAPTCRTVSAVSR